MNDIIHSEKVSLKTKIMRAFWNIACCILFRPFPTSLFWPWRRLILLLFGAKVARTSRVYRTVKIWAPWNLRLDANAVLGPEVVCYNQDIVWLKENAVVSQYTHLCTAGHDTSKPHSDSEGLVTSAITIEQNAWVGTRAFIGMGVVVGNNSIVGANAGVYKDVEPMTIVGGNPAKIIKCRVLTCD